MGFSHFFILSSRGDVIISRDCEGLCPFFFLRLFLTRLFSVQTAATRPRRRPRCSFATSRRCGELFLPVPSWKVALTGARAGQAGRAALLRCGWHQLHPASLARPVLCADHAVQRVPCLCQLPALAHLGGHQGEGRARVPGAALLTPLPRTTAASTARRPFAKTLCSSTSCWTRCWTLATRRRPPLTSSRLASLIVFCPLV